MSRELINEVGRAIARSMGWTVSEDVDLTTVETPKVQKWGLAAAAAIQVMTPQDKLGSPEQALRAAGAFIRLHVFETPPCFEPKDEVVALALRARQGDRAALLELLHLVELAEGAAMKGDS